MTTSLGSTRSSPPRSATLHRALRLGRPWPFRLEEIEAEVVFHHGEEDANVPLRHAKELAERIPGSRLRLYPGEGHISILDGPLKGIVEDLLAP
jgi:pimeloyl-ACP methyl ester carboxylesterase